MARRKDGTARREERWNSILGNAPAPIARVEGRARPRGRRGVRARNRVRRIVERMQNGTYQPRGGTITNSP